MVIRHKESGKTVDIDDQREAKEWLSKGFEALSDQESEQWRAERAIMMREVNDRNSQGEGSIYLRTVNKRGDGYGMSSHHIQQRMLKLGIQLTDEYRRQKIGLLYHRPHGITQLENEIRVVYTMFESSRLPREVSSAENPNPVSDWKRYCDFADLVIVPSKWCQGVFAESGIQTEVVPLGYNEEVYGYLDRQIPQEHNKDFVFLHYNAFNLRKGFTEVLKAFLKAFPPGNLEPVKLILKTTLESPPIPLPKGEYPNIEIVTGDVSEQDLKGIMQRSNCFVFPSRGEGFGITPLEAMATGLPAIIPNAHGLTEYFDHSVMYEARVSGTCPGIYHSYKGMDTGEMVVCDIDHLADQMRYIYTHQHEAKEKGRRASEYVQSWTYTKTAEKLKQVLDRFQKTKVVKRRDSDILAIEAI